MSSIVWELVQANDCLYEVWWRFYDTTVRKVISIQRFLQTVAGRKVSRFEHEQTLSVQEKVGHLRSMSAIARVRALMVAELPLALIKATRADSLSIYSMTLRFERCSFHAHLRQTKAHNSTWEIICSPANSSLINQKLWHYDLESKSQLSIYQNCTSGCLTVLPSAVCKNGHWIAATQNGMGARCLYFFCSNATMAFAWSLYKILLVVLISAKEADTEVGASRASYDKGVTREAPTPSPKFISI